MVIYTLCDSGAPGVIRYVGKSVHPNVRLRQHMKDLDGKCHRKTWIRSVLAAGRAIEQNIIAFATTNEEANRLECYYIQLFREMGFDLTNSTIGGDGVSGYQYTEEQKKEIGKRSRNAWDNGAHTPESIEATASAHRGMKRSEETCANISASKLGKPLPPFTEQHKKNLSQSVAGKPKPYMVLLNQKPWTDERRSNQSAAQLKRYERNKGKSTEQKLQESIDRIERKLLKLRDQLDKRQVG